MLNKNINVEIKIEFICLSTPEESLKSSSLRQLTEKL